MVSRAEVFDRNRPLLFSIAYRMSGSLMEAEDVVQEAYLRWQRASEVEVSSPSAYLSKVVTRLCIDRLALQGCAASSTSARGCPNLCLESVIRAGLSSRHCGLWLRLSSPHGRGARRWAIRCLRTFIPLPF